VSCVFFACRTVFGKFQSVFCVFLVFYCCVVSFFAIFTSKNYHSVVFSFNAHCIFLLLSVFWPFKNRMWQLHILFYRLILLY